ncbi:hypothetical protein KC992_04795 [Candidatus Saccharibacteria bacterium]|nr:hypothetical protein [Candidatus Saccharibacteria bacterium]
MSTAKKSATKKKQVHKNIVKKPKVVGDDVRVRKKPSYKSFRYHKRVKHPAGPLPGWWMVTKKALRLLNANRRNMLRFFFIYGLLYVVFVRGVSSPVSVQDIRDSFKDIGGEDASAVVTNFTFFSLLVQSTTSAAGDIQGLYQLFFLTVSVLALIWLFRQQQAGHEVSMKEAFYRGMYPLIPFSLVALVITLQTIPASIGNFLFSTVISKGIAINAFEQTVWLLLYLLLLLLSFYLITSSAIALFVATLPEMTPMRALKKAKELVKFRRFSVLRKIFALVILVLVMYTVIVFPLIFVSATLAQIIFYSLTILLVPFATAYLFVLYRELL